jgi:hypothetical protein
MFAESAEPQRQNFRFEEQAMTLCIGWRENGEIRFAADSRISFPNNSPFDEAIKIAPVRLEVDMMNPYTGSGERLFHGDIAMCFSGSTVNAFALREALYDRMRGLLTPSYTFERIAQSAFEQYVEISKKLCFSLAGPSGQSAVLIAGYCDESQSIKAFKFLPSENQANEYDFGSILTKDGEHIFIGSGKPMAERLLQQSQLSDVNTAKMYDILKAAIDCESEPSVGGRIRVGFFDRKRNFRSCWVRWPTSKSQ